MPGMREAGVPASRSLAALQAPQLATEAAVVTLFEHPVYQAARKAGCTDREAQVLAAYVQSNKVYDAAKKLGMSEQTAKNHLHAIRRRLGVPSTRQVLARLLS